MGLDIVIETVYGYLHKGEPKSEYADFSIDGYEVYIQPLDQWDKKTDFLIYVTMKREGLPLTSFYESPSDVFDILPFDKLPEPTEEEKQALKKALDLMKIEYEEKDLKCYFIHWDSY